MSERGVCICPDCGCQFSDDQKAKLERADLVTDWMHRPIYRWRVTRLARKFDQARSRGEGVASAPRSDESAANGGSLNSPRPRPAAGPHGGWQKPCSPPDPDSRPRGLPPKNGGDAA